MTVWSNRLLILLGALGIFVAGVLSYTTWQQLAVPCGGNSGCTLVQTSQYSKVGPVPVSYLGLLGYVGLFALAIVRSFVTGGIHRKLSVAGFVLSGVGMLFSLFLTYVSLAVIGAKCAWCLSSLAIIVVTFIAHAVQLQSEDSDAPDTRMGFFCGAASLVLALFAVWWRVRGLEVEATMVTRIADATGLTLKDVLPIEEKIRFGGPDAKVTLVEFADLNCPTCRNVYKDVERVVAKYNGKVRLAFHNYPLIGMDGHETSLDAAVISELAADHGLFWKYMDTVMDPNNTERMKSLDGIIAIAGEIGLSRGEITTLFSSSDPELKKRADAYYDRVDADITLGRRMKVMGTPIFFLFGEGVEPISLGQPRLETTLNESPWRELLQ